LLFHHGAVPILTRRRGRTTRDDAIPARIPMHASAGFVTRRRIDWKPITASAQHSTRRLNASVRN
jgi:hypothetical protein